MDITIRPMTRAEHNYCYSWSSHLMAAAGCIGHLRGDMGREGNSFYTTWFDHQEDLKVQAFKDELDTVVNALRFDPACGGALASRGKLAAYCYARPESGMGTITREYGFRVDTEDYAYMLRLNPNRGEYNFYIYCYVRERLDSHMAEAQRGIRFVTPGYRDLFRLADGDKIRIVKPDGKWDDRTCRYVGETHMTCGWDDRLYPKPYIHYAHPYLDRDPSFVAGSIEVYAHPIVESPDQLIGLRIPDLAAALVAIAPQHAFHHGAIFCILELLRLRSIQLCQVDKQPEIRKHEGRYAPELSIRKIPQEQGGIMVQLGRQHPGHAILFGDHPLL